MSNEIIINRMFSGEYLEDDGNIGHEIINLYKPDNGDKYYIYLLPYGDYSTDHTNTKIDAVLLVRGRTKDCVEVLAKATGIERIFDTYDFTQEGKKHGRKINEIQQEPRYQELSLDSNYEFSKYLTFKGWTSLKNFKKDDIIIQEFDWMGKQSYEYLKEEKSTKGNKSNRHIKKANFQLVNEYQKRFIKENNIRYGGKLAYDLFSKNTTTSFNMSIFITFSADKIIKVNEPFFLATSKFIKDNKLNKINENCYELNGQKFYEIKRGRLSGSAAATFYCKTTETDNYNLLDNIINKSNELWGNDVETYTPLEQNQDENFTFLSLIKKEYDELSYSNMFAYYFDKYNNLFKYFVENVKDRDGNNLLNNTINIDKTFEVCREEKHIDILVKCEKDIFVIENKIKSGINGEKHNLYGDTIQTQLDNYFDYIESEYQQENKYYLIISPNYNKIDSNKFSNKSKDKYKIIYYSEIYRTLLEYSNKYPKEFENDIYFNDFLKAIAKHKTERDIDFEKIMKQKMQKLMDESK